MNKLEVGGHKHRAKQQLNSMKLGLPGKESKPEEGGHRHRAKKQLNSVKLGLPY